MVWANSVTLQANDRGAETGLSADTYIAWAYVCLLHLSGGIGVDHPVDPAVASNRREDRLVDIPNERKSHQIPTPLVVAWQFLPVWSWPSC
jgi:hypothetical protein